MEKKIEVMTDDVTRQVGTERVELVTYRGGTRVYIGEAQIETYEYSTGERFKMVSISEDLLK